MVNKKNYYFFIMIIYIGLKKKIRNYQNGLEEKGQLSGLNVQNIFKEDLESSVEKGQKFNNIILQKIIKNLFFYNFTSSLFFIIFSKLIIK